ncbi:MAG: PaaI family thioesterase [Spirochaetales bacterium]|nr:PaaI family thioesterase [Spirochaetales bacterium]
MNIEKPNGASDPSRDNTDPMDVLVEVNRNSPFHTLLGIQIKELSDQRTILCLSLEKKHMNYWGITHGGVLTALCDAAIGMAIRALGRKVVTLELNISYLETSQAGDFLEAEGKILRSGKNTLVGEAEIRRGDTLVAKARGTFFALP